MKLWLTLVMLLGVALSGCNYEPSSQKKKDEGYKYEFGMLPPKGVKVTHARLAGIRDSETNRLRFETQVDPIPFLLSRGFTKSKKEAEALSGIWRGAPQWGNPEPQDDFDFYECEKWPALNGLDRAEAYVAVSRSEHVVYFLCRRGG
jgi:hypothetical protein